LPPPPPPVTTSRESARPPKHGRGCHTKPLPVCAYSSIPFSHIYRLYQDLIKRNLYHTTRNLILRRYRIFFVQRRETHRDSGNYPITNTVLITYLRG
jgi:hypothetical protein